MITSEEVLLQAELVERLDGLVPVGLHNIFIRLFDLCGFSNSKELLNFLLTLEYPS